MPYPKSFIDEVRTAADIVTVVSDHLSLRRAGKDFKGLCPFHAEKSPSFTVNRDRGLFHCFGCSAGGDVFKFVMLKETLDFQEAVRHLAQRFGIPLPELEGDAGAREDAAMRESLLRMHDVATAWFRAQLAAPAAARIRGYLAETRGLTDDTISRLQLGYAPPGHDLLRQHLLGKGFAPTQLAASGLTSKRNDGSEVDRFRNRLMIPIARASGSVVAFGGRALAAGQVPKYLNSPETPLYTKGRTLYGLHLTKSDVRQRGFVLLVEGYFDYAQVLQATGLPVVATCGTALTPAQVQQIRQYAAKAVLCFDPDAAGQTAAERSSALLVAEGFDVNVMVLPGGADPDTFLQQQGRDAFVEQLTTSRPYLEFLLERASEGRDMTRDEPRRAFLHSMLTVAAQIPDPAAREQFADKLAVRARVTNTVVRELIRRAAATRQTELPAGRLPSSTGTLRPAERDLLWALVHVPAQAVPVLLTLEDADCEGLTAGPVLRAARDLARNPGLRPDDVLSHLFERLTDQEQKYLTAIAADRAIAPVTEVAGTARALRRLRLERRRGEVQQAIEGWSDGDGAGLNRLLTEKLELQRLLERERSCKPG